MCYKQKCKVVSLNLAHPLWYLGRNDGAGRSIYRQHGPDIIPTSTSPISH